MGILYLIEQGACLRKASRRLIVEKDGVTLQEIPSFQISSILIFGSIQVTTQAISYLLDNGIDIGFFSMSGHLRGRLVAVASKNIFLRLAQYECTRTPERKLELAKRFIRGKLANQRTLLLRYQRNHPEVDFSKELDTLNQLIPSISQKKTVESLMGVEGAGSGAYFRGYSRMVSGEFSFKQRRMHPSPDPVNALLSLGYTLMTNELASLAEAVGFDPFIGFLHGFRYGRQSLPLDLVEEFRHPVVDMLTLNLLNKRVLSPEDFVPQENKGMYLTREGLKRYLAAYEKRMAKPFVDREGGGSDGDGDKDWEGEGESGKEAAERGRSGGGSGSITFREYFKRQIEKLQRALLYKEEYTPFTVR
ncbi:MAG: CRISPR-associated endonuclease Cas1 [bacterium]